MATTGSKVIKLKLLIDSRKKRVLFAEAGKDFTDFLFSLLSISVGTVIRLLSTTGMVGSLGILYQSLENLSDSYIESNACKETLLKPQSSVHGGSANLLSLTNDDVTTSNVKQLYSCCRSLNGFLYSNGSCFLKYVTDDPRAKCPDCNRLMSKELTYVPPPDIQMGSSSSSASSCGAEEEGGLVKGVVTYMIMDDLEVKPMSTISTIAILNAFKINEVGTLQEKIVSVGIDEGLKLLKASLQTKTVLTHVFLRN